MFFHKICEIFQEHIFFQIISRYKFEAGKNQAFYNNIYIIISTFLQSHFFFPMLSSTNIMEFCFFKHFQLTDVKSNRCFSGLPLISIILWEHCENNIKTFWFYSYENKWIISRKILRFFFLRLFKTFPSMRLYLFS